MKDVIEHLVEDLDWRLSPAGKSYRPEDKELTSWGVERHGCWPSVLLWASMMLLYVGAVAMLAGINEDFFLPLGAMMGLVLSFFFGSLAGGVNRSWQKSRDKKAYRKLLKSNERFMLVEYSKYLSRKIHQAQHDPTLGGSAEILRLRELQGRITEMLRKGGNGRPGRQSRLEEEATIAESLLEAYGHADYDPLRKLDERLPEEVRVRLLEEDRIVQTRASTATPTAAEAPEVVAARRASADGALVPQPASKADSELPRWARELGQIIKSLDLDELLSDEGRKGKSRTRE